MPRLRFLVLFFASGCAAVLSPEIGRWPTYPDARYANVGAYIQVAGVGKPDASLRNETQRRSGSRDAAILDARANLKAYLEKLYVPGKGTVGELAALDKAWRERLGDALSGIDVASTAWEKDGTAAVLIRAERKAVAEALGLEASR